MGLQNATVVYKIEFSPNNLEDRNSYDMTLINGSLLILPDHNISLLGIVWQTIELTQFKS
jgi:hypothetical protein